MIRSPRYDDERMSDSWDSMNVNTTYNADSCLHKRSARAPGETNFLLVAPFVPSSAFVISRTEVMMYLFCYGRLTGDCPTARAIMSRAIPLCFFVSLRPSAASDGTGRVLLSLRWHRPGTSQPPRASPRATARCRRTCSSGSRRSPPAPSAPCT